MFINADPTVDYAFKHVFRPGIDAPNSHPSG